MRFTRIVLAMAVSGIAALSVAQAAQKPKFEVASIKSSTIAGSINRPPGRFIAVGQPLKVLIGYAYRLRDNQILGGLGWMDTERWEIQAKLPDGIVVPRLSMEEVLKSLDAPDTVSLMLQSLLEERFQLKVHRETRDLPIYELSIAKSGLKMMLADDQSPIVVGPPTGPSAPKIAGPELKRGSLQLKIGKEQRHIQAKAISISVLVNAFVNELHRPVSDKTGLTGLYDFTLEWAPDTLQATPESVPSGLPLLSTAVQEQLGLKLESARGPVEVLVIDSVSRPTEN